MFFYSVENVFQIINLNKECSQKHEKKNNVIEN